MYIVQMYDGRTFFIEFCVVFRTSSCLVMCTMLGTPDEDVTCARCDIIVHESG